MERKKAAEIIQKAAQFVLVDLLQDIPDPELSITEADIDLQLRETLISTSAEIDLDLGTALQEISQQVVIAMESRVSIWVTSRLYVTFGLR